MGRNTQRQNLESRNSEVEKRLAGTTPDEPAHHTAQLEKTILIAAAAIVDAIWRARY